MVKKSKKADHILIITVLLLLTFGIIVLASASTSVPRESFTETFYFLIHQLVVGLIPGIVLAFFLARKISLSTLQEKAPLLLLINLVLMVMVFLPLIGKRSGEAARWIELGPLSLQPSEFLKLTFILYLASWLESKSRKSYSYKSKEQESFLEKNLIAFLTVIGIVALLLFLQSDISTLGVIAATAGLMYFFAKTPVWHTVLFLILGILALVFFVKSAPYRMKRIAVLLDPEIDPMGFGYQIKQALIAVGSGKITGLGLGMSKQKLGLLPHPISDSIFAILAEETGFIGSVVLIILFLVFLWRGYKIGKEDVHMFSRLTALGITSWIVIQSFINIASMIGIFPLTGIPLPFISYGGSALVTELGAVGVLINISKNS